MHIRFYVSLKGYVTKLLKLCSLFNGFLLQRNGTKSNIFEDCNLISSSNCFIESLRETKGNVIRRWIAEYWSMNQYWNGRTMAQIKFENNNKSIRHFFYLSLSNKRCSYILTTQTSVTTKTTIEFFYQLFLASKEGFHTYSFSLFRKL